MVERDLMVEGGAPVRRRLVRMDPGVGPGVPGEETMQGLRVGALAPDSPCRVCRVGMPGFRPRQAGRRQQASCPAPAPCDPSGRSVRAIRPGDPSGRSVRAIRPVCRRLGRGGAMKRMRHEAGGGLAEVLQGRRAMKFGEPSIRGGFTATSAQPLLHALDLPGRAPSKV